MNDPRRSSQNNPADEAFMREARIGLSVLAILIVVFLYVALGRYNGWNRQDPIALESYQHSPADASESRSQPIDATPANSQPPLSPAVPELPRPKGQGPPPLAANSAAAISPRSTFDGPKVDSLENSNLTDSSLRPGRSPDRSAATNPKWPGPSSTAEFNRLESTTAAIENNAIENNTLRQSREPFSPADQLSRADPSQAVLPAHQQPIATQTESSSSADQVIDGLSDQAAENAANVQRATHIEPIDENETAIEPDMPTEFVISIDGDSFWTIAQRVYGDGRYFRALYDINRQQIQSVDDLRPGTRVATPSLEMLRRHCGPHFPRELADDRAVNSYTTKSGETLFDIARQQLGQASRYLEILKLNRDRLPPSVDHQTPLSAGQELRMPRN